MTNEKTAAADRVRGRPADVYPPGIRIFPGQDAGGQENLRRMGQDPRSPSNAEIRDEILRFAALYEGESRFDKLRDMRLAALRMMRLLHKYRPRLIGSVLTGHIRQGSDIDLHCLRQHGRGDRRALDEAGLSHEVSHKHIRKNGEEALYTHVHVAGEFETELTVYSPDKLGYVFKSSITEKAIERASLPEFEEFLDETYPDMRSMASRKPRGSSTGSRCTRCCPFRWRRRSSIGSITPRGTRSTTACRCTTSRRMNCRTTRSSSLAALLHDVGKAIDPEDHVQSGLQALDGFITDRTRWFIEHHMERRRSSTGRSGRGPIGGCGASRLRGARDLFLARCDRGGREVGVQVPELEERWRRSATSRRCMGKECRHLVLRDELADGVSESRPRSALLCDKPPVTTGKRGSRACPRGSEMATDQRLRARAPAM